MSGGYWVETLGCAKNQVDSDKLAGLLESEGYVRAGSPDEAELVVVNTCAFIEAARQESVETVLEMAELRSTGSRLVVTGCMAERYGDELAAALPEVDLVAGFGVPVSLSPGPSGRHASSGGAVTRSKFDLLELPRPAASAPWAYLKVAEGCDRKCGFCAIPSFRGRQRSRMPEAILAEAEALGATELVMVAQDLASWGRDLRRAGLAVPSFTQLVGMISELVDRVRLLYLYPSELDDELMEAIIATGCPYFDLSLQHASGAHVRRMRRWGDGGRFLASIARIRQLAPEAALRSSFIVGYPGETEEDHDVLIRFLEEAELDWAGFFAYSLEEGTYAAGSSHQVDRVLVSERLSECAELQDRITASKRSALVGSSYRVLVDSPGVARGHREAPEIDGVVTVPTSLAVGSWHDVNVLSADGPDVDAAPSSGEPAAAGGWL